MDVTVGRIKVPSRIGPSGTTPLHTAMLKATEKVRHYRAYLPRYGGKFVPFALEVPGAMGPEAKHFIRDLAEEAMRTRGWPPPAFVPYWLRRIALTQIKASLEMIVTRARRQGVALSHAMDVVDAVDGVAEKAFVKLQNTKRNPHQSAPKSQPPGMPEPDSTNRGS